VEVLATVSEQRKAEKVIAFKKKRRQGYARKKGAFDRAPIFSQFYCGIRAVAHPAASLTSPQVFATTLLFSAFGQSISTPTSCSREIVILACSRREFFLKCAAGISRSLLQEYTHT
jgi:hypothetical protein